MQKRIIAGGKVSAAKRAKFAAQDRAAGRALARGTFRAVRKASLPSGLALPLYFSPGIRMKEHIRFKSHGTIFFNALLTANQAYTASFNATSMFNPLNTLNLFAGQVVNPATGHRSVAGQPLYFDQWAAMYFNYKVLNCRILVRVQPTDTAPWKVCVVPSNNVLTDAIVDNSCQRKRAKWIIVENTPLAAYNSEIKMQMRPWDIHGVTELEYLAQDGYGALFSASPSFLPIWNVVVQTTNNASLNGYFTIELEFDAELTDPVFSEAVS